MNYQLATSDDMNESKYLQVNNKTLQEQVAALIEWKHKAKVQLEYFRLACTLYNLCNTENINELLLN